MIKAITFATGLSASANQRVLAAPICATGAAAYTGDTFISARFCRGAKGIIIHYDEKSECKICFAAGTLTNLATYDDGDGETTAQFTVHNFLVAQKYYL